MVEKTTHHAAIGVTFLIAMKTPSGNGFDRFHCMAGERYLFSLEFRAAIHTTKEVCTKRFRR
jgi:hypothetical protein